KPMTGITPPTQESAKTQPRPTAGEAQRAADAAAQFAIDTRWDSEAVPVPETGTVVPLPGKPEKFLFTDRGRTLALWFPDLRTVGFFNLGKLKMEKYLDVDDAGALVAGGTSVLLTYQPELNQLDLYDVRTLERRGSKRLPESDRLICLAMGFLESGHAFALRNREGKIEPVLIRLPDFSVEDLRIESNEKTASRDAKFPAPNGSLTAAMNDSGNYGVVASTVPGTVGMVATYSLREGGVVSMKTYYQGADYPQPLGRGEMFVTEEGLFTAATPRNLMWKPSMSSFSPQEACPVLGADAFVYLPQRGGRWESFEGFYVCSLPTMMPILEIPVSSKLKESFPSASGSGKGTLMASATANRLISLGSNFNKLIVLPLGLREGTSRTLVARPGTVYERKIELPAGATAVVETGPQGLTLDVATSTLRWQVPTSQPRAQVVQVLLRVKSASGADDYLVQKITVL
ncbi:MAG: hypothetical protein ACAI34_03275, partial [Verrucomicrobium sp.]|nr:hypothetical protein [Verrucomicrobium sp.]